MSISQWDVLSSLCVQLMNEETVLLLGIVVQSGLETGEDVIRHE